jgi:hypothetical protein
LLRVECIRLDEHTLEIQLAKQLLEHSTFVILACGVAGLSDRHTQSSGVKRHLGDVDAVGRRPQAAPPPLVGSIEPRRVLPSQIN